MSSVIDDYLVDPKVSLLDKTRMQAQVLLPVLRAFRAELGKDKADAIVKQALRDWSKQLFAAIGDGIEGGPRRKWAAINSVFGEVSGKEVEIEILRHDKEALDIDVTRCRFAEFFRALGEPELGALLICEADFDIASVGEGAVSLDRAQTIMEGAPSCTFPLQVRTAVVSPPGACDTLSECLLRRSFPPPPGQPAGCLPSAPSLSSRLARTRRPRKVRQGW
jgi:L-2-amino-thiazoline-4-carboxylic acid hydrolase